jgi:hypothetical protein
MKKKCLNKLLILYKKHVKENPTQENEMTLNEFTYKSRGIKAEITKHLQEAYFIFNNRYETPTPTPSVSKWGDDVSIDIYPGTFNDDDTVKLNQNNPDETVETQDSPTKDPSFIHGTPGINTQRFRGRTIKPPPFQPDISAIDPNIEYCPDGVPQGATATDANTFPFQFLNTKKDIENRALKEELEKLKEEKNRLEQATAKEIKKLCEDLLQFNQKKLIEKEKEIITLKTQVDEIYSNLKEKQQEVNIVNEKISVLQAENRKFQEEVSLAPKKQTVKN